jgi:hypothetical protein
MRIVESALTSDHFAFLKEGDNFYVVLSPPYGHVAHYGRDVVGNVTKLNCSTTSDCPGCIRKFDKSNRWFLKVFDVETASVRLLDACFSIVDQLNPIRDQLSTNPVRIFKMKDNSGTWYSVEAIDRTLSQRDWSKINERDVDFDMDDISRPRSPAEIEARLRGDM